MTVSTISRPDGKTVQWNHVAKAAEGYSAIELQPVQPHTVSLKACECSECHGDEVAAGYGNPWR